jgi:hypothetical protein
MHKLWIRARRDRFSLEVLAGSGARTGCRSTSSSPKMGRTIFCSPHKIAGPQTNDVVLQPYKKRVDQVAWPGWRPTTARHTRLCPYTIGGEDSRAGRHRSAQQVTSRPLPQRREGDGRIVSFHTSIRIKAWIAAFGPFMRAQWAL